MILVSFFSRFLAGYLLWLPLVVVCSALPAQTVFQGVVRDSPTREGLPFANVQSIDGSIFTTADVNGYFTIHTGPVQTSDSLRFTYVGYESITLSLSSLDSSELNAVTLVSNSELPTIEVSVPAGTRLPSAGILTPSLAELERTPAVLGEVDPLKSLTLLPGISGGTEGTAGLNIRGGNPNQTDLLVDGNRIYNVNHIGGFLSALPAFATKTITVYKGGVPARYGGRLSGVVDVTLREGRRDRLTQTYTLGLGTVQAGLEGPVSPKSSFLFSGRYSYPVILYNLGHSGSYRRNEYGTFSTVGLYDLIGKYRHDYGRHVLTATAFVSGDRGWDQDDPGFDLTTNNFGWGNHSLAIKHQYRDATGGIWTNSVQYLNYRYVNEQRQSAKLGSTELKDSGERRLTNGLNDLSLNSEYARSFGPHVDVYGGITASTHAFRTSVSDRILSDGDLTLFSRRIDQDTLEMAAYASADFRFLRERLQLMLGWRMSGLGFALPPNPEPRLRISLNVFNEFFLHASYDRHVQYVHQLTPEVTIFPNELYLLANDRYPAERSAQLAVGMGARHGNLQWSVDVFRKQLDDLVRLNPGQERDEDFVQRFPSNVIGQGQGLVKGVELYLKQESEPFSFSLAYTYSRSDRQYTAVNNGEWYPFTFSRPHDIGITASKALPRNWRLNLAFIYQSGHRFTAPVGVTAFYYKWGDYNGARLPPYHVLNLGASKSWTGKKRDNRYHRLTLSVYNAYNRPNPYAVSIRPNVRRAIDATTGREVEIFSFSSVTYSLFPILPSASYTVTIK